MPDDIWENLPWTGFYAENSRNFPQMVHQWTNFRAEADKEEAWPLVNLADCALWEFDLFNYSTADELATALEAFDTFESFCRRAEDAQDFGWD